jgi:hypothetical protein
MSHRDKFIRIKIFFEVSYTFMLGVKFPKQDIMYEIIQNSVRS